MNTTTATTEGNKKIAAFMGKGWQLGLTEHPKTGKYVTPKYDTSWDWLMPVVEKIESLGDLNVRDVSINSVGCMVYANFPGMSGRAFLPAFYPIPEHGKKIEAVYSAVSAFIDWYNEQKEGEAERAFFKSHPELNP